MREVYGESMSPEEFDWFFDRNPAGPRLLSEVREDGRSLGVLAMSYARAQVEGEEQLVAFAVARGHAPGSARARDLRRRSSSTNEARAAAAGATMALGFTNPMAGPILVGKLGWHDLYRMRLWARPLRLRRTGAGGLAPRSGELPRVVRRAARGALARGGLPQRARAQRGVPHLALPRRAARLPGARRRARLRGGRPRGAEGLLGRRRLRARRPRASAPAPLRAGVEGLRHRAGSPGPGPARAPTSRPASCPRRARSA